MRFTIFASLVAVASAHELSNQGIADIVNGLLASALPTLNEKLPDLLKSGNMCPYNIGINGKESASADLLEHEAHERHTFSGKNNVNASRLQHLFAQRLQHKLAQRSLSGTVEEALAGKFISDIEKAAKVVGGGIVKAATTVGGGIVTAGKAVINAVAKAEVTYTIGTLSGLCSAQISSMTVSAGDGAELILNIRVTAGSVSVDLSGSATVTAADLGLSLSGSATVSNLDASGTGTATICDAGKLLSDDPLGAFALSINSLDIGKPNIDISFNGLASIFNPVLDLVIGAVQATLWGVISGPINTLLEGIVQGLVKDIALASC